MTTISDKLAMKPPSADDDGVFVMKGSNSLGLPRVWCNAPLMRSSLIIVRIG
jgi:hypothetical protein